MNQINEYMEITRAYRGLGLSDVGWFEHKRPYSAGRKYPKYDTIFQKKVNKNRKKNKLANKSRSKNRK